MIILSSTKFHALQKLLRREVCVHCTLFSSGWNTLPQLKGCSGMVFVLWIDQIIGLYALNNRGMCWFDIFLLWRWSISKSTTTCTGYPADSCRDRSGTISRLSGHWTRPWDAASDTGECSGWLIRFTNCWNWPQVSALIDWWF